MKKVTFFIPHYQDHSRLVFMLTMLDKISNFPCKFVVYDSSPKPIGNARICELDLKAELIYKEFQYTTKGHTYPYVLRDFCLSDDGRDGAFILPNDELIILNYDEFSLIEKTVPFTCGTQISFCPETRKVAEYSRAKSNGFYISRSEEKYLFMPQYHGTFMPRVLLKPLGKYLSEFIKKWGDVNTTFIDFVIIDLLEQLNIYYSRGSIYLQEKLAKRKSNTMYNHPSQFISSINTEDSQLVRRDLLKLWNSVESLSSRYFKDSLNYILNPKRLKNALIMANLNKSDYLFKVTENNNPKFSIERIDTFTGYHIIGSSLSGSDINFLFNNSTQLGSGNNLSYLREVLNSYKISDKDKD